MFHGMLQALLPLVLALAASPTAGEDDRSRFLLMRNKALAEAGQRHLEYGVDLRKEGLCLQAAEQIVRAVEVSGGQNPGALMVLRIMQDYDDAFWKRRLAHPSAARLDGYAREAHKLDVADEKARLEAAAWAWSRKLWEDAHAEYLELLAKRGEPLEFSKSGCITLEGGMLPEKESQRIRAEAVSINERLYIRDRFLAAVPQVKSLFEQREAGLCVRSTRSLAEAQKIHALVLQLLPVLEADLGARPAQRLMLILLDDVAVYDAYLDAVKMPEHKAALGFADQPSGISVVCTGKASEQDLPGVCLHEMTHQYRYAVSRSSMPSWYDEGLAETYGGQGVFSERDGKLVFGGLMPAAHLDVLRREKLGFGLRELLGAKAITLLGSDEKRAHAFYTESWAFVRFLRSGAGEDVARRFAQWETTCRGALVDAVILGMGPDKEKPATASDLFLKSFGKELPKLEDAFFAWLAKL
jgi:hypothetical protein